MSQRNPLAIRAVLVAGLLAHAGGCQEQRGIRSYTAPAESAPSAAASDRDPAPATGTPQADLPAPPRIALKQTPPEGWTEAPLGTMRKASYATEGGAEVTAFVFGANPDMADPLGNINRWRREIGLGPTTAEALPEITTEVELAGEPATLAELVGESETTLAAMAVRGSGVWFFKIRGPGEAVAAEREAFIAWLSTVEFPQE